MAGDCAGLLGGRGSGTRWTSGHLTPHLGGVVTGTTHLLSPASPQWAPSFQSALTTSFPQPQSLLWVSHPHSYLIASGQKSLLFLLAPRHPALPLRSPKSRA